MTLLNKVVEMEYIITINVNTFFVDAIQNPVNDGVTTGPIQVEQNDQKTMITFFENLLVQCIPTGLELFNHGLLMVLMYNDQLPGFAMVPGDHMNLSVQQFMQSITPSSVHLNRNHYTFVVNVAARPVAAAV